jgi:UDPglucose 6-dehydrogenase
VAMDNARREYGSSGIRFCTTAAEVFEEADAVLLATEWPEYIALPWCELGAVMRSKTVLDGRNVLDRNMLGGFHYIGIGT